MSKRRGLPGSKMPPRSLTGFFGLGFGRAATRGSPFRARTRTTPSAPRNHADRFVFLSNLFTADFVRSFITRLLSLFRRVFRRNFTLVNSATANERRTVPPIILRLQRRFKSAYVSVLGLVT